MDLTELSKKIFQANAEKGFWDEKRNIGEALMLIVTELSEACEAHRRGKLSQSPEKNLVWHDDWHKGPNSNDKETYAMLFKDTFEDEIADALIRILDLCGGLNIEIEWFVQNKLKYNKTRPYKHAKQY